MAAATLDEFFPGRVQLCFGMGSPLELEAAGVVAEQPLRTLRETLELSRQLLSGAAVDYQGQRFRISGRHLAMGSRPVPLWLAASGPQMLRLAGEKATASSSVRAARRPSSVGRSTMLAAERNLPDARSRKRHWCFARSVMTPASLTTECAAGWVTYCAERITPAISNWPVAESIKRRSRARQCSNGLLNGRLNRSPVMSSHSPDESAPRTSA
jgi:hypothetical protein